MPRQNRATPFGNLIQTDARGTLMGNRGCLHDTHQTIVRYHSGQRWIICLLAYKGNRQEIMKPGQYTQIFFLDEATALAAGHRPCSLCQRARFNEFRSYWATANLEHVGTTTPLAGAIDAHLHQERMPVQGQRPLVEQQARGLPTGTFVVIEHDAYLVLKEESVLLRWTPGYDRANPLPLPDASVSVLTPPSVVRALDAGYPVHIHPNPVPDYKICQ